MNNFKDVIKELEKDYGDIDYPANDSDAYQMFPKYNIVYNKLEIAKAQGLDCNPFPIEPKNFLLFQNQLLT